MAYSSKSMVVPLIVACALFMQNLDSTIIATALPSIARSFHDSPVRLSLAITAYMLSLAIFIPISGWIADRYGAATVFRAAIGLFTLASLVCGLCDNRLELVAARVVQGMGGAMMVPVGRLVLLRSVDRTELVRAISYLTTPGILGPILGPPLGGLITTYWSWRWVFFVNLPIGIIGIVLVTLLIEDTRAEESPPLDWRGFVLSGASLVCVMYGLDLLAHPAFGPAVIVALLAVGTAIGVVAIAHARGHRQPLIDLTLMRISTFSVNVSGGGIFRATAGQTQFLVPLMLQAGFGMTAFASGLVTLASGVGSFFMKMSTGPVLRRFGYRTTFIVNGLVAAALVGMCGLFTASTPVALMFVVLLVGGFFRSLQFTALNSLAFAEIAPPKMSAATSLSSMTQQLTNGMGVALAAILLHATQLAHGAGGRPLAPIDFHVVFPLVAGLSLLSIPFFRSLAPEAGSEVTGHRPAARGALKDHAAD